MTYVKLIARSNTWFKAFTEVYDYNTPPSRRLTVDTWNLALIEGSVCVRGLRVCEHPMSEGGGVIGDEYEDGEYCLVDEFHLVCHTEDPTPNKCPHPDAQLVRKPYGNQPNGQTCCGVCGEQLFIGALVLDNLPEHPKMGGKI